MWLSVHVWHFIILRELACDLVLISTNKTPEGSKHKTVQTTTLKHLLRWSKWDYHCYRNLECIRVELGEKLLSGRTLASPYTGAEGPEDAYGLRAHVRERLRGGVDSGGKTDCGGSLLSVILVFCCIFVCTAKIKICYYYLYNIYLWIYV